MFHCHILEHEDDGMMSQFEVVAPLAPTQVVSRKVHGSSGTFDISLPLTGNAGIECRSGGSNGNYQMVFSFPNTLTSVGGASVTSGTGSVTSRMIDSDAHNYIVNLTGVTNAQRITVSLTNVTDSAGGSASSISASMGILVGDTNGNGSVASSDIAQVKAAVGKLIDATNFRSDSNASGRIIAADTALAKWIDGTY